MGYLFNHSSDGRGILQFDGSINFGKPHPPKDLAVFFGPTNHAFDQRDFQHTTHRSISLSYILDLESTSGGNGFDTLQLFETINGSLDDIVRVVGSHTLGKDVLNAYRF